MCQDGRRALKGRAQKEEEDRGKEVEKLRGASSLETVVLEVLRCKKSSLHRWKRG